MRKSTLYWFCLTVMALVSLGIVVLYSASEGSAARFHKDDPTFFLVRQLTYLGAATLLFIAAALFDYRWWRSSKWLSWAGMATVVSLLVLVLFCKATKGSHRWIEVGPVHLQPGELAKLMMVIVVARWLDLSKWRIGTFKWGALFPAALIAVFAGLVAAEPDYGSTAVIGLVGGMLMFVAGSKFKHIGALGSLGAVLLGLLVYFNKNRMARLFNEDLGYQAKMALAAIGNSDIWGCGIRQSMQKHSYLPEAHTDFVFAVGAEELGIVFSVGVLLLFIVLFALSVYFARKSVDRYGRLLALGMGVLIFFQAMFNLGVVCKAFPTKGVALPFFSFGGTNMLCTFFAVGTILSVGRIACRESRR